MSIYTREGSRYWWMELVGDDGQRIRRTTGIPKDAPNSRKMAREVEAVTRANIALGKAGIPKKKGEIKFFQLVDMFLKAMREDGTKTSTLQYYRFCIVKLMPFLQFKIINLITKWDADKFRHERKKDGVKEATINRNLAVLHRMLVWAVEQGLIRENPIRGIKLASEQEHRPIPRVLSPDDEQRLISAVPKRRPYMRPLLICALDTGLRKGEILNLEWANIDFARGVLTAPKGKTAGGTGRVVPMTGRLTEALRVMERISKYVFFTQTKPVKAGEKPIRIDKAWWGIMRRSGVQKLRFHDLRHTFNVRLMELGVMREVRMVLMGHSLGKDAHAVYTHVELPMLREAIGRLDRWLDQREVKNAHTG